MLDLLGVPYEIGAKVPLEFTVGDDKYNETFTLSGYWTGDPVFQAQQVWLSREYVDEALAGKEFPGDSYTGKLSADVWFNNTINIEDKIKQLIAERGYAEDEITYGVGWAYAASGFNADLTSIGIVVLVIAMILLSGYLIIYSVFTISVNADIHFYGLLKTIGTTGKQIRKIIRTQALVLSAAGIPLGLALGYICGVLLSPVVLRIFDLGVITQASSNPAVFVFAAAFSGLTVFIGCRKPGKIASKVSPVEAVKYSGASAGGGKKTKKTRAVTPFSMAWANVTREKRRLFVIVTSLSLALILLNSAFSATKSFDMDAYLSNSIISDFNVADYSIFGPSRDKSTEGVTPELLREAEERGAKEIINTFFSSLTLCY
jgi:putative ABC transport system permease protein